MAKIGDIVVVKFFDHAENVEKPMLLNAYGHLIEKTSKKLVIDSWEPVRSKREIEANTHTFTIVRAAVKKITVLVPKKKSSKRRRR